MPDSVGEAIVKAVAAALNAPGNKPATTYRTRVDAINSGELPAFVLFAVEESSQRVSQNVRYRTRTLRLEAHVAGVPPADSLTDPLYVFAINTLYADAALFALIRQLDETRVQWEGMPSYEDRAVAAIDFDVVFSTFIDPTVQQV